MIEILSDIHSWVCWMPKSDLKWYLYRQENITCCCCCQRWRFEKMGAFLLKSHRSAKSLDPNRVCEWTLSGTTKCDCICSNDCHAPNRHCHNIEVLWILSRNCVFQWSWHTWVQFNMDLFTSYARVLYRVRLARHRLIKMGIKLRELN